MCNEAQHYFMSDIMFEDNKIEQSVQITESNKKEHLTEKQLAEYWNVSPKLIQKFRDKGNGPKYKKIGGCVRYAWKDIIEYDDARTFKHTSEGK